MLKGEVFGRQLFENQIFALFINTFLNGNNGVCGDYLNGMEVTYSGSNVTVDTGAVCIQGRFLEEDSGTTISAGTNSLFCKLVIEIDLDKVNTDETFNQGYYKIITDVNNYPAVTQTDIVGTNSGVYQYELARFKTSTNGISDFVDTRTYLDIPTIYDNVRQMVQDAIDSIEDGSAFVLKTDFEGTTLYESETGTNQTIQLNENPLNFKRVEIDYLTNDGSHTVHYRKENIPIYQETTQVHDLTSYYFGSSYMYTYDAFISINTDSIVFNTNRTYQQNVNNPSGLNRIENAPIKILKITGFNW